MDCGLVTPVSPDHLAVSLDAYPYGGLGSCHDVTLYGDCSLPWF